MILSSQEAAMWIRNDSKENQIRFWFMDQYAPVKDCGKPSFVCCLRHEDADCMRSIAECEGMQIEKLCGNRDREVLFIYKRERIEVLLNRADNSVFFQEAGYNELHLNAVFQKLGTRIQTSYEKKDRYPHEIGILLGYPIGDVRGFIQHHGQNYLLAGYWKVYENEDQARRLFHEYDVARCKVLSNMIGNC